MDKVRISFDLQKFVLEQQYYDLSQLYSVDDSLDDKAIALLQMAILIFVFAIAITILNLIGENVLLIGMLFAPIVIAIVLLLFILYPKNICVPGTQNWNELYEHYVYKENDDCFDQILSDCTEAIAKLSERNRDKALAIKQVVVFFGIQVVGLFFLLIIW